MGERCGKARILGIEQPARDTIRYGGLTAVASLVALGAAIVYASFALGTVIGGSVDHIYPTARNTLTLIFLAGRGTMLLATVTAIFWLRITIALSAILVGVIVGFGVVARIADWHGVRSSSVVSAVVPALIVIVLCWPPLSQKYSSPRLRNPYPGGGRYLTKGEQASLVVERTSAPRTMF